MNKDLLTKINSAKEAIANARLIAAAPDMFSLILGLAQKLYEHGKTLDAKECHALWIECDRLVEKIEGHAK